jgi:DNA-binding NtrC family response regulator
MLLGMPAVICSARMQSLMHLVERVAQTNAAVLITGESGSGKEAVARAIHSYSLRCAMPWVDVNCAALPDHLVESELFGYEKGAFSGADSNKPGLFELADKGTLFLDEIAEMEPKTQVKLLRVLDGVPYYRLGGRRKVSVDVRIVAATNQELEEAMRSGRFRKDLYHRLSQIQLAVPPLRERREAIIPLAEFFLRQHDERVRFSLDAVKALRGYSWPGNVRELRNVVMKAALFADNFEIRASDLPSAMGHSSTAPSTQPICGLEEMERETILQVLGQTGGHHQKAADLLGISRRTLSRKLKLYGAGTQCESPVPSECEEPASRARRGEERKPAQGEVRLFWNERPGFEQTGHLIDVS